MHRITFVSRARIIDRPFTCHTGRKSKSRGKIVRRRGYVNIHDRDCPSLSCRRAGLFSLLVQPIAFLISTIGLATKRLRIPSLGGIDKTRNRSVANPIYRARRIRSKICKFHTGFFLHMVQNGASYKTRY